jgi:hypothetical protein
VAVVDQPQRLVMNVLVEVALLAELALDLLPAPQRPVVLADQNLADLAESRQRDIDVTRPSA